jgi:hypothetical protein
METIVKAKVSSVNGMSQVGYFVSGGGNESHHRVSAEDLLDVAASLSKPLFVVQSSFDNGKRDRKVEPNLYNLTIWANVTKDEGRAVSLKVTCSGPPQDDAERLFAEILAQFTREVGRRNRGAPLLSRPPAGVGSKAAITAQPQPTERTSLLKTLTTHPLPVTVIGSLVAGGIIFLLSLAIVLFQRDDKPTAPTTTTVTTAVTVYAPAPSPPTSAASATTTTQPHP